MFRCQRCSWVVLVLVVLGRGALEIGLALQPLDIFVHSMVVDPIHFNETSLTAICRTVLKDQRHRKLVRFRVFTDKRHATPVPRFTDLGFGQWQHWYKILEQEHWRIAELMACDGKAVLRIRDGDIISRLLLEGDKDPLFWEIDDSTFEILHLSIPIFSSTAIDVFARSPGHVSKEQVRELLLTLRERIHPRVDSLRVRGDHWFILDLRFPVYYWFEKPRPPTRSELRSSPRTTSCSFQRGGVSCY